MLVGSPTNIVKLSNIYVFKVVYYYSIAKMLNFVIKNYFALNLLTILLRLGVNF